MINGEYGSEYRYQLYSTDYRAPAALCITRDELKAFNRITNTANDAVIDLLLPGIQAYAEQATGHKLSPVEGVCIAELPWNVNGYYAIPGRPCRTVNSVYFVDGEGTKTQIPADDYLTAGTTIRQLYITGFNFTSPSLISSPAGHLEINFTAGYVPTYTAPGDVVLPADLKLDVLRLGATIFEHREDIAISDLGSFSAVPDIYSVYTRLSKRKSRVY